MRLPNFLIIGAPKAGTTSAYDYLVHHPQVFMPSIKEPRFFALEGKKISPNDPVNKDAVTTFDAYQKLFAEAGDDVIAVGEASPMYFTDVDAPEKIKKYLGKPKLIAFIRNPIDRTYSHYLFALQQGYEEPGTKLSEAITNEKVTYKGFTRTRRYISHSLYFKNLSNYLKYHDLENIKVVDFDDFIRNQAATIADICNFLGIEPITDTIKNQKLAKSGAPKNKFIHKLLNGKKRIWGRLIPKSVKVSIKARLNNINLEKPVMNKEDREKLVGIFEEDVKNLSKLLGKDYTYWLK